MQGFWRLISILICLSGFLIAGGVSLVRGESFFIAVVKAVLAFTALHVVENVLGGILVAVTGSSPGAVITPESRAEETRPAAE